MQNFKIDDYSIFTNSANSVIKNIGKINTLINEGNSLVQQLNSEDVFQGPICDNCISEWKTIEKTLKTSASKMITSSLFLNNSFNLYQSSDNNNSSNIGGV